jgi:TLD
MATDIVNKDSTTASTTALDYYDSWLSLDDTYGVAKDHDGKASGASSSAILLDLHILGTSANDQSALPHVLSPPLMASLQAHLPWSKRGENMWLKYSLVRDGSSLFSFLKQAPAATSSFLAIETVDGEVFGAFTSSAWHKSGSQYFGDGNSGFCGACNTAARKRRRPYWINVDWKAKSTCFLFRTTIVTFKSVPTKCYPLVVARGIQSTRIRYFPKLTTTFKNMNLVPLRFVLNW